MDEFQGGFGLLSARLTFKGADDRWSFALVGDNLTDKKFLVDAGNTGDYFGIPTFIAGSRRTYRAGRPQILIPDRRLPHGILFFADAQARPRVGDRPGRAGFAGAGRR
ncbi:hypothetical protein ACFSTI_27435 [Rhizorhabdus histidinilytica]